MPIIRAQALMSQCSYTTLKRGLAQKQAQSNFQLAPNCKLQAGAGRRLSWHLTPTRRQPLWSSDSVGSRISCPQAGRSPAVLLHGTACGSCGKTGGAKRHHFIPKLQTAEQLVGRYHPYKRALLLSQELPHALKRKYYVICFSIIRIRSQMVLTSPQNRDVMLSI